DGGDYYRRLLTLTEAGEGFTESAVIGEVTGLSIGDRYLFDAAGECVTTLAASPAADSVAEHLPSLTTQSPPATGPGLAFLPHRPRVTLLLVGGGHVSQAVAGLAADCGFSIWVIDDRERFASKEMFPAAGRLMVGSIGETLRGLVPGLTPATYALVMTRGH